jgi:predicted esterase YcpF (UPF0227 family)
MAAPAILYIHGFNSSPQSAKAQQLAAHLARHHPDTRCSAPALPNDPARAIALLEQAIVELGQPLLLGSSLGGCYATYLAEKHRLRAVLVNPAVRPWRLFAGYLGPQVNHYTGEHWELTAVHVEALRALEVPAISRPEDFLVLLQTGDETLDWRDAADYYRDCSLLRQLGGSHGFDNFADVLPLIYRFAGLNPV